MADALQKDKKYWYFFSYQGRAKAIPLDDINELPEGSRPFESMAEMYGQLSSPATLGKFGDNDYIVIAPNGDDYRPSQRDDIQIRALQPRAEKFRSLSNEEQSSRRKEASYQNEYAPGNIMKTSKYLSFIDRESAKMESRKDRDHMLEAKYGGIMGGLIAAGIGVADGATFGLDRLAFNKLGPHIGFSKQEIDNINKELNERAEANPMSSFAGEMGGMAQPFNVVNVAIKGGKALYKGAKGAGEVVKDFRAARAGMKAEEEAAAALAKEALPGAAKEVLPGAAKAPVAPWESMPESKLSREAPSRMARLELTDRPGSSVRSKVDPDTTLDFLGASKAVDLAKKIVRKFSKKTAKMPLVEPVGADALQSDIIALMNAEKYNNTVNAAVSSGKLAKKGVPADEIPKIVEEARQMEAAALKTIEYQEPKLAKDIVAARAGDEAAAWRVIDRQRALGHTIHYTEIIPEEVKVLRELKKKYPGLNLRTHAKPLLEEWARVEKRAKEIYMKDAEKSLARAPRGATVPEPPADLFKLSAEDKLEIADGIVSKWAKDPKNYLKEANGQQLRMADPKHRVAWRKQQALDEAELARAAARQEEQIAAQVPAQSVKKKSPPPLPLGKAVGQPKVVLRPPGASSVEPFAATPPPIEFNPKMSLDEQLSALAGPVKAPPGSVPLRPADFIRTPAGKRGANISKKLQPDKLAYLDEVEGVPINMNTFPPVPSPSAPPVVPINERLAMKMGRVRDIALDISEEARVPTGKTGAGPLRPGDFPGGKLKTFTLGMNAGNADVSGIPPLLRRTGLTGEQIAREGLIGAGATHIEETKKGEFSPSKAVMGALVGGIAFPILGNALKGPAAKAANAGKEFMASPEHKIANRIINKETYIIEHPAEYIAERTKDIKRKLNTSLSDLGDDGMLSFRSVDRIKDMKGLPPATKDAMIERLEMTRLPDPSNRPYVSIEDLAKDTAEILFEKTVARSDRQTLKSLVESRMVGLGEGRTEAVKRAVNKLAKDPVLPTELQAIAYDYLRGQNDAIFNGIAPIINYITKRGAGVLLGGAGGHSYGTSGMIIAGVGGMLASKLGEMGANSLIQATLLGDRAAMANTLRILGGTAANAIKIPTVQMLSEEAINQYKQKAKEVNPETRSNILYNYLIEKGIPKKAADSVTKYQHDSTAFLLENDTSKATPGSQLRMSKIIHYIEKPQEAVARLATGQGGNVESEFVRKVLPDIYSMIKSEAEETISKYDRGEEKSWEAKQAAQRIVNPAAERQKVAQMQAIFSGGGDNTPNKANIKQSQLPLNRIRG